MRSPLLGALAAALLAATPMAAADPLSERTEMRSSPQPLAEGTNRAFSHTVATQHPEAVWRLWTTPASWGQWDQGLTSASLDGEMRVGAVGEIIPRQGNASRFTVTAFEEGRSYTFETQLPLAILRVQRAFNGDRSAFTHTVTFEGAAAGPLAAMLGPGFRRALPPTMAALNRLAAEGEP